MKTIIISIFLFFALSGKSQTSDVMYVPNQQSLVVSYNSDNSPIGFYVGGYLVSTFPDPYIYTTPVSRLNRVGLNFSNNKISIMGGVFTENFANRIIFQPDLWFKVYPLRILFDNKNGADLTLGLNYMKSFRYGVGISIPFRGIYFR